MISFTTQDPIYQYNKIFNSVAHREVIEGSCRSVTKGDCWRIAVSRGVQMSLTVDMLRPPGCYLKTTSTSNNIWFNTSPIILHHQPTTRCTDLRVCICTPHVGGERISWHVFI